MARLNKQERAARAEARRLALEEELRQQALAQRLARKTRIAAGTAQHQRRLASRPAPVTKRDRRH